MNRELKFRAWGVDIFPVEKKYAMAYFSLKDVVYEDRIACVTCYRNDDLIRINYEDTVIMQYTGLKDKNGVEIYEGDILKKLHAKTKEPIEEIGVVEWRGASWGYSHTMWPHNSEVIGNIYENPELKFCDKCKTFPCMKNLDLTNTGKPVN